ncbi:hypothetical protein F4860DRAFT_467034 [Xylaria cubensis]|nr:hypothetical protein F4860DRAFT_467034 [Xylaria cubensis]
MAIATYRKKMSGWTWKTYLPFRKSDKISANIQSTTTRLTSRIKNFHNMIRSIAIGHILTHFLVFQFPSLAFTTFLLGLYLTPQSWNPTANQLGALLIAAKVHEALIITSLFDIAMYHIRRGLLGHRGIPYGFLPAPFQLTSPLYLFTPEFWSCLRSTNLHSGLLALLLVLSVVLAALAGASSGIIIIPKLGWRALPPDLEAGVMIAPSKRVYPLKIDLSSVTEACLENSLSKDMPSDDCPFQGLVENGRLTDYDVNLYANLGDGSPRHSPDTINLTISNFDLRSMNYWNSGQGQLITATTPLKSVESVLSNIDKWILSSANPIKLVADIRDANGDAITLKQPRVITQCLATGYSHKTDPAYYEFYVERLFYPQFTFTVPTDVFQDALVSDVNLGFIDVNEYLPNSINASIAIWTWIPRTGYGDRLTICLVDARWVETNAWILPLNTGSKVQHSLAIDTNQTYENVSSTSDDLIRIDPAWGNFLDQPILHPPALFPLILNRTSVFGLLKRYLRPDALVLDNPAFTGLTIILTGALATVPGSWNRPAISEFKGPWKVSVADAGYSPPNLTEDHAVVSTTVYENAYSYGFSEVTTILSWVVLFSHYLFVLVHLIVLCVHGRRVSMRWGRLGDVISLALNSRPADLLTNPSAGVKGSKIWRLNATVREVDAEGKVELVLRDGKDSSALHDYDTVQSDCRDA